MVLNQVTIVILFGHKSGEPGRGHQGLLGAGLFLFVLCLLVLRVCPVWDYSWSCAFQTQVLFCL